MKSEALIFFLAVALVAAPVSALADHEVNINSADLTELDSIPEIGPSLAQKIIDYRTANGPFETIEDLQKVSGIGSGVTYSKIKDHITVGASSQTVSQEAEDDESDAKESTPTRTSSTSSSSKSKGASVSAITVAIGNAGTAIAGAAVLFEGQAFSASTELPDSSVRYVWNFGDGATGTQKEMRHTYAFPGSYVVQLTAESQKVEGSARMTVVAAAADIALKAPGDGSLVIANNTAQEVDVGWWSLADYGSTFIIPAGTFILSGAQVHFSPEATGLAGSRYAALYFPDGTLAARAVAPAAAPALVPVPKAAAYKPLSFPAPPMAEEKEIETEHAPNQADLTASAAEPEAASGSGNWLPFAGLFTLIALGAVGTWYARGAAPAPVSLADTFKIE